MYAGPEQILIIFVPPRCRPKAPCVSQVATLLHAIIVPASAGRIVVRRRPICGGPPYRARSPCPRARFSCRGRAGARKAASGCGRTTSDSRKPLSADFLRTRDNYCRRVDCVPRTNRDGDGPNVVKLARHTRNGV